MKWWLLISVSIGWLSAPLRAQTRAADSLLTLLNAQPRADTLRVRRLLSLSNELIRQDASKSAAFAEEALGLSRQLADTKGEGAALIRLGTAYRLQNEFGKAREVTKQAMILFLRLGDNKNLATAYLQLSFIENSQSNPPALIQAALKGLVYAEKAHDLLNQERLQMLVGSTYVQLGNYKEAIPMLKRSFRTAQSLDDKAGAASILSLLGTSYQLNRDWRQALSCFQRSAKMNRAIGDTKSVTGNNVSISELYAVQGNYPVAQQYGEKALASARATRDTYNLLAAEVALGRAYLRTGHIDSALALAHHSFTFSQVRSVNSRENLRNASEILAQAYAQRGQYLDAYRYRTLWAAYRDSIQGEAMQKNTAALRYGYELDRKQDQIKLLTQGRQLQVQKADRQRQQLRGLVAGLVGLLLLAGLLFRNIFLKQRANRTLNEKNEQIAHQRDRLDQALTRLKVTQSQLVQSEKMVALAALTAGVAHEIQNPLNFVNNFSEVSLEMLAELKDELQEPTRDPALETSLLDDLKKNLLKINQHGGRAAGIVRGMLEHTHADPGQRQAVDLNDLAQAYLRLAYHSLQSTHRDFTVASTLDLDPALGSLHVVPQELGRVLLNLFTNAFYAVHQKATMVGPAYTPSVRVRTRRVSGGVELHVRDNGTGIAPVVLDKIFDPFFTTKPPGEGTGLGLWLSYDIITNGYDGTLTARSEEGAFTEFVLTMPQDQTVPVVAAAEAATTGPTE